MKGIYAGKDSTQKLAMIWSWRNYDFQFSHMERDDKEGKWIEWMYVGDITDPRRFTTALVSCHIT